MKLLLLGAALIALSSAMIQCPKDACKNMKCDEQLSALGCEANGGRYRRNGGFCGCCDTCVQQLGVGDNCFATMLLGAVQTAECGAGLECDFTSKTCVASCGKRKKQMEEKLAKMANRPLGFTTPVCDADGTYAGKQCTGSKCYCVDKAGKTLGYTHDIWKTSDSIKCQCARDKDDYRSKNIIGRLFHCSSLGDYESVQCTGSVCYCVDTVTGKQLSVGGTVPISEKDSMNC